MAQAVRVFSLNARGPSCEKYAMQLQQECIKVRCVTYILEWICIGSMPTFNILILQFYPNLFRCGWMEDNSAKYAVLLAAIAFIR